MTTSLHLTTSLVDNVRTALYQEGSNDLKSSGFALAIYQAIPGLQNLISLFVSDDFTGQTEMVNSRSFWVQCGEQIMENKEAHRSVDYKGQTFGLAGIIHGGLVYCIVTGYADTHGVYDRLRSLIHVDLRAGFLIPHELRLT